MWKKRENTSKYYNTVSYKLFKVLTKIIKNME